MVPISSACQLKPSCYFVQSCVEEGALYLTPLPSNMLVSLYVEYPWFGLRRGFCWCVRGERVGAGGSLRSKCFINRISVNPIYNANFRDIWILPFLSLSELCSVNLPLSGVSMLKHLSSLWSRSSLPSIFEI